MQDMYSRIEEKLKGLGMNKRQLAEAAQIPYSSLISAFNKKYKSFSMDYIVKIASALDVDTNFLLTGETSKSDYAKEKSQSLEERKAINALYKAYGFKYEDMPVEGELPYRSDLQITAPDGRQARLTHAGKDAYGRVIGRELKRYALYLHEKTVKEITDADEAQKEGADDGKKESPER